jgi:hypothetical protein
MIKTLLTVLYEWYADGVLVGTAKDIEPETGNYYKI